MAPTEINPIELEQPVPKVSCDCSMCREKEVKDALNKLADTGGLYLYRVNYDLTPGPVGCTAFVVSTNLSTAASVQELLGAKIHEVQLVSDRVIIKI